LIYSIRGFFFVCFIFVITACDDSDFLAYQKSSSDPPKEWLADPEGINPDIPAQPEAAALIEQSLIVCTKVSA